MKQWFVAALLLVIVLAGCVPVYVPNVRNAPLFTKAGEFQGTVMYGTSDLDLQGAVAVTNNIALMGNYSYGDRNTDSVTQNDYHKHEFYEGALGFYKNDKDFCFELFAGYGRGEASSYGDHYIFGGGRELAKGKFQRIFFQPSFGLNKKIVNIAFSPRFSWVDFTEFSSLSHPVNIDLSPKMFFEPAVTARFNFMDNRFYGNLQIGIATSINGDVLFDYENVNISTGLGFRLGGLHWEDQAKK